MKCEEVEKLIVDFLDRKLGSEITEEIEQHLASCEKCLDEVKETKELFSVIAGAPAVKPAETLRINFYHMLHGQINKNGVIDSNPVGKKKVNRRIVLYVIAAGLLILVAGTFLGLLLHTGMTGSRDREISQMKTEISDLRKTTMMSMIQQESSSGRIMAVSYAQEIDSPDQNVIDVLVKTLNGDRNVNVRLAAAYALGKFAGQQSVCDSLVASLSQQTDPVIQVTLINILAERKARSALIPIQKIISNRSTMNEVKTVAKNSLHYFI
jgi:hypothetical protein